MFTTATCPTVVVGAVNFCQTFTNRQIGCANVWFEKSHFNWVLCVV
jgi:hypothetical protein